MALNFKPTGGGPKRPTNILTIAICVLVAIVCMKMMSVPQDDGESRLSPMKYSEFLSQVDSGKVDDVKFKKENDTAVVRMKSGDRYNVELMRNDPYLASELKKANVTFSAVAPTQPSAMSGLISMILPTLVFFGLFMLFMMWQAKRSGGAGGNPFSMGKSKARTIMPGENAVTFADVAGCDEAKEEVAEVVDFLRDPKKYEKLGGRSPKGLLLLGPPGTGKTLLARAMAGEAKVPFYTISGSDFVEMFVGVGAARVRDMFAVAKENAPCIIFIDEIDAVGRKRGGGMGGGNDEREQTLNQMLVEMDGFESSKGIVVIGATNRADVLDDALKRPGRLDRQVHVGLPDIKGREQILKVHARKTPLAAGVDLRKIARSTPGFAGADLANLINEAALFAARRAKKAVDHQDISDAADKIMMGPERRSAVIPMKELRMTAYHELGHAAIGKLMADVLDPLRKVTIMPRGGALGVTISMPENDQFSLNKKKALAEIAMLFGGRIAEELYAGGEYVTTGASNDYERATKMATAMVMRWGMSNMGPRVFTDPQGDPFGGGYTGERAAAASEATQLKIDAEIARILDEQYEVAKTLLKANWERMERISETLLDLETLDGDQFDVLWDGGTLADYDSIANDVADRRKKLGTWVENYGGKGLILSKQAAAAAAASLAEEGESSKKEDDEIGPDAIPTPA